MTEMMLPQFGMGMADGTIIAWHKAVGDRVTRDEPLCDVEAAKTTVEVLAPCDGILQQIVVPAGSSALVNTVIAIIGDDVPVGSVVAAPAPPPPAPVAAPPPPPPPPPPQPAPARSGSGPQVEPRARRAARTLGIDLERITGTGPGGRIIEEDVIGATQAPPTSAPALATGQAVYRLRMRCDAAPLTTLLAQLAAHFDRPVPFEAVLLRAAALACAGTALAGQGIGFRGDDGAITTFGDPAAMNLQAIAAALSAPDQPATPMPPLVIEWHGEHWLDEVMRIGHSEAACLTVNAPADSTQWHVTLATGSNGPALGEAKTLLKALKRLVENPLAIVA